MVVQYGRILHYFREMSQKLALGDAINHRKPWRAQTKRRLAIRWTIVGMVVVFGVGIFPSGTVSLPPPPAPDYPFATVSDFLRRRVMPISGSRRTSPSSDGRILSFPQDLLWMEDGTLTTPDGRTCQVGFRLQYTRTAFLSAAQWCFQTAWKDLIAQGRVHAESLALPGLDQAKLVQDAFGSCLLLRQGTQVWRVSLNHMEDGVWPPCLVAGGRAPVPGDHSSCLIFWMAFFSRREICAWEMPMWRRPPSGFFPQRSAGGGWFSPGR